MRFSRRLLPLASATAVVCAVALPAATAGVALTASPAVATEQRAALDARTMDAFVASIPAMRAWTEQHDDAARAVAPKVLKPSALAGNPFAMIVTELRGTEAYSAMDTAVARHGFETPEDWAGVANRVTKALGVLASRTDEAENAMTQAQREIQSNPNLSDQDRMTLQGMLMAVSLFANAPQEDVAAVEPYSQRIIDALRAPL
jgi:hypothetical protein